MSHPSAPAPATGSRPLADMLLALAGLVQQLRALPSGHPAVAGGAAALERVLEGLLRTRTELVVEVGNVQLLVEGMETNPDFDPLHDLARQLRNAEVGALLFRPGVTAGELIEVLGAVAVYAGGASLPGSRHLTLRPVRASGPHSTDPWRALERLVLDDPDRPQAGRDPVEVAIGLELHPASVAFDARVLELLAQVAMRAAPGGEEGALLEGLLTRLPAAVLRRLLSVTGPVVPAKEFLQSAGAALSPEILVRLSQAVALGRDELLSTGALRVLAGIATDAADDPAAASALREEFLRLVELAYPDDAPGGPHAALEPERLLKLALESGIVEEGTLRAADRMIARRQVAPLLALLETVPREDPVARPLRGRVFHPQTVRALLGAVPVDLDSLDRLVPAAGIEAAPALLDALAESRERRVRLRLLDLLARYGDAVGPLALERMEGMPWYVQRNLLALLGRLTDLPASFSPQALLAHRDPRVRHEAVALALADPAGRELALSVALDSDHEPTLRLGLAGLADRCPPEFAPRVISRVADPALDPEVRALAVTALATVKDPVALRLLRRLVVGRGIASLGRLAQKSPPMLAAIRVLAGSWSGHPKVIPLLETARQSRDDEVREAARHPVRRSGPAFARGGAT